MCWHHYTTSISNGLESDGFVKQYSCHFSYGTWFGTIFSTHSDGVWPSKQCWKWICPSTPRKLPSLDVISIWLRAWTKRNFTRTFAWDLVRLNAFNRHYKLFINHQSLLLSLIFLAVWLAALTYIINCVLSQYHLMKLQDVSVPVENGVQGWSQDSIHWLECGFLPTKVRTG